MKSRYKFDIEFENKTVYRRLKRTLVKIFDIFPSFCEHKQSCICFPHLSHSRTRFAREQKTYS